MCTNIDDLINQSSEQGTEYFPDAWIRNNIAGFKIPKSYSTLKDIQDIVKDLSPNKKGWADRVIYNLYFYNSKAKIVKDKYSEVQLLVLPEAEIIIDFFHDEKEKFIGKVNVKFNDIGELIISEQDDVGYIYYTLNEALLSNRVLQSVCELEPWRKGKIKKGVIGKGTSREIERNILDIMFHGNHNWASNTCYSAMKKDLVYNLLPFKVLCYENSSFLGAIDNYYVEAMDSLDYENGLNEIDLKEVFAIFANHPINQSSGDLHFYGYFCIDAEKTKEMKHLSFKRIQTVWG